MLGLWLCLATVLAHAALPVGSPLARKTGSAFSISTHDVALTRGRRAVPAKPRKLLGWSARDQLFVLPGLDAPAWLPVPARPQARAARPTAAFHTNESALAASAGRGANQARAPPFA